MLMDRKERAALREVLFDLVPMARTALLHYLVEISSTTLSLTVKGVPMSPTSNYQLNAGDSVVFTLVDIDDVTGAVVTPDAGSVTAVLGSGTDTVVVDPSGTFLTITAGDTLSASNNVVINATVNGVASGPVGGLVAYYDVVAVTSTDTTTLSGSFGTEVSPGAVTAPASIVEAGKTYTFNQVTGNYDEV
jgi:hypothetical protein